jgi:hypothetical protein
VKAASTVSNRTGPHPLREADLTFFVNICPGAIFMTCSASNNASGRCSCEKEGGMQGTQLQVSGSTANVSTTLHMFICMIMGALYSFCTPLKLCRSDSVLQISSTSSHMSSPANDHRHEDVNNCVFYSFPFFFSAPNVLVFICFCTQSFCCTQCFMELWPR